MTTLGESLVSNLMGMAERDEEVATAIAAFFKGKASLSITPQYSYRGVPVPVPPMTHSGSDTYSVRFVLDPVKNGVS